MRSRADAKRSREKDLSRSLEQWQIEVPNDPINEQVILSSMALDAPFRKRAVKLFKPDHFFTEKHRAVFVGFVELERKGLEYDPAVLVRLAPDADIRFVEALTDARTEVPENLDFHVDTLLWDNQRARVTEGPVASLLQALQNPREAPDRVRALARSIGAAFEGTEKRAPYLRDPKEVVREMMANLRRRIAGEAFYPFGIDGLDYDEAGRRRLRPGAAPGLVTVLTGMSGSGKTTLSGHKILGLARQKRRVAVGAWEVRAPMTLELVTTLSLKWNRARVLDGKSNQLRTDEPMTGEELRIFEDRANAITPWITFIENPFRRGSVRTAGKITNDDYLDILESHIEASGCDAVLLDLFDRVLRYRRPDDEQEALWRMLEMTNEYQIHTTLVHQQLIKGEGVRKDKKPSVEGLKGSSAYVDVAAAIIAPHIPARWKNVPDDKFQVYVLKQRFGPPGAIEFDWDPETGQISNARDMKMDEEAFEDAEHEGARDGTRPAGVAKPKRKGKRW